MYYYLAVLFWLHLIGISLWVGGSLLTPLVILPAIQGLEPPARLQFMAGFSRRMTPLYGLAIVIVIVTGILQAGTIFHTYNIFLGLNILTVKVFVALLMVANGLYTGIGLSRKALALAPAPGSPPSPDFVRTMRLLGMHSWIQAGLSVIILLLVGLLTAR
jgi:uncharacterized membrane protein